MRGRSLTAASMAGSLAPLAPAFAHGSLTGTDAGDTLFWFYGGLAFAVVAFFVLRRWIVGGRSPERRELKSQLDDLERALAYRQAQLRNADDYPRECGLTVRQRRALLDSTASIRRRIEETRTALAAPAPAE